MRAQRSTDARAGRGRGRHPLNYGLTPHSGTSSGDVHGRGPFGRHQQAQDPLRSSSSHPMTHTGAAQVAAPDVSRGHILKVIYCSFVIITATRQERHNWFDTEQ